VLNRACDADAWRFAIRSDTSRAGGQQPARNLTCRRPPIIRTPARDSRIPAAQSMPGS